MTLLARLADQRVQPWRNGIGETRELLAAPSPHQPGFDWRISVATILSDVPFSCFDGADRSLLCLSGGPLWLTIDGQRVSAALGQVVSFPGEAIVTTEVSSGPVSVLNIMTRRLVAAHWLRVAALAKIEEAQARQLFAIALTPLVGRSISLSPGDLVDPLTARDYANRARFAVIGICPAHREEAKARTAPEE